MTLGKSRSKTSVYRYLLSKGVLENGNHSEIQQVRREYWREYKSKWRKEKRKKEKEFTITLNNEELREITNGAKAHYLSRTQFIKQSVFAYLQKSFIVPDIIAVKRIEQLLAMIYNEVSELMEEDKINHIEAKIALQKINEIESAILPILHNPKSIEEYILDAVKKDYRIKAQLTIFINSL